MIAPVTITVSEDLNARTSDPCRFCAAVDGDTDPERGGFGATELAALAMLIEAFPRTERASLHGATIARMAIR
jgi:hypothetical protein